MRALLLLAALASHRPTRKTLRMRSSLLTPETALKAAQAALKSCRDRGFQATVAVVDRMGVVQVLLRDRFAGPHTPDMATAKAYTAASFRTNTTSSPKPRSRASGERHPPSAGRRRRRRRHDDRGGRVAARRDRRVGRARRPRGRRLRGCRDRRDPGRYRTMKARWIRLGTIGQAQFDAAYAASPPRSRAMRSRYSCGARKPRVIRSR